MLVVTLIDLAVLSFCVYALAKHGRLAHSHPAMIYLIFHFIVVTFRLIGLLFGAPPLFSTYGELFEGVTDRELRRGAIIADLALLAFTAGCLLGGSVERSRLARRAEQGAPTTYRAMREPYVKVASIAALVLGAVGLLAVASIPGIKTGADLSTASSYIVILFPWCGLGLVMLMYWYGFRWWLLAPMCLYLAIAGLQGQLRFRFIIPIILMTQIWLDRRGRRWPTRQALLIGFVLLIAFFPAKSIGRMAQRGESVSAIFDVTKDELLDAFSGRSADLSIFDQLAASTSLVDERGSFFYGEPYLALVTLPIPRALWSEKPGLADYLQDISTEKRPMDVLGMVTTLAGDAYLNFWYVGVIVIPALLGWALTRFHVLAYHLPYRSVTRFAYLLVACNLIQVYRDGLIALPLFVVVTMLPLFALVVWHRLFVPPEPLEESAAGALVESADPARDGVP